MNDKASRWRKRAEELRTIADGFRDKKARDDLIKVAQQWDTMARQQERAAERAPPAKPRARK